MTPSTPARYLSENLRVHVDAKAWPGGVLGVFSQAGCRLLLPHGFHTYAAEREVVEDDVFDLASLTKVVPTTTLIMCFVDAGRIDLDQPVGDLLPEFVSGVPAQADLRRQVTVRYLLAHTSGLPAYKPFYRLADAGGASFRDCVLRVPLARDPGAGICYSDIGFMILGFVAEAAGGDALEDLVAREICGPLGLEATCFRPPASWLPRIPPTERKGQMSGFVHGEVHDENARFCGGVSGHAGLFSTAADLGRFGRMMLKGGMLDSERLVRQATWREFTREAGMAGDRSRCLGWAAGSVGCSGGDHLHAGSFGHTGFTGTSLWIDPDADLAVVLVTNAVHPRREDRSKNSFFARRRALHSAVYEAFGAA